MRRALFLTANALGAVVIVLLILDPGRDLTPVFALLAVTVVALVLAWQWPRWLSERQSKYGGESDELRPTPAIRASRPAGHGRSWPVRRGGRHLVARLGERPGLPQVARLPGADAPNRYRRPSGVLPIKCVGARP
jgi:hypothetical protein